MRASDSRFAGAETDACPIAAVASFDRSIVAPTLLAAHRRGRSVDRPSDKSIAAVASRLSVEDIVAETNTLYERWPRLPMDDRRKIAEALCEKIVIGENEIDITYSCVPSSEELCKNQTILRAVMS